MSLRSLGKIIEHELYIIWKFASRLEGSTPIGSCEGYAIHLFFKDLLLRLVNIHISEDSRDICSKQM